jgi:hypothetical protein
MGTRCGVAAATTSSEAITRKRVDVIIPLVLIEVVSRATEVKTVAGLLLL